MMRRSDNVALNATPSISAGTDPLDSNYAATSLIDENPAKVAKILSTTGAWLLDFGSAQRVDLVALIHHNFDAGANVVIQANSSDSWGAPAFSCAITIPAWLGTGTGRWPVNPFKELVTATGYSSTGWRYWRILVTGNSQNLQLGQVILCSTIRTLDPNFDRGFSEIRKKPLIENKTSFLVSTIYILHTIIWLMTFFWNIAEDAIRNEIQAHWEDAGGRAYPWLFIPNGLENKCFYVRYTTTEEQMQRNYTNISKFTCSVEEAARGLRPGT
jgi:hypothetical protein